MKLKKRVLASIMSILILSSFSQLIGNAAGGAVGNAAGEAVGNAAGGAVGNAATQQTDMYAQKKDDVQFNSDSILTHAAKETNADLDKIKTIKKFAEALGTDTLYNFMQQNNYNVKIKFDDEMCSIINEVSEDAHISRWDCSRNNVQIINNSGDNLKAHIGVEFEKECGITEISLSNSNELADIDLPAGKDTDKILLQLAGGKIETNVNLSVLNKLYDNGKVKIGVAKVFITGGEFINSYKGIANKIKDYTTKTKVYADKFKDAEITKTSTSLLDTADNLPGSADQAYEEYSRKVTTFVNELKLKQGKLNEMKIDLCISNKGFRENLNNFVDLNQQLTEKVNALTNKPVNVEGGNSTNNPNDNSGDKQGDGTDSGSGNNPENGDDSGNGDGHPSGDSPDTSGSEQVEPKNETNQQNDSGTKMSAVELLRLGQLQAKDALENE